MDWGGCFGFDSSDSVDVLEDSRLCNIAVSWVPRECVVVVVLIVEFVAVVVVVVAGRAKRGGQAINTSMDDVYLLCNLASLKGKSRYAGSYWTSKTSLLLDSHPTLSAVSCPRNALRFCRIPRITGGIQVHYYFSRSGWVILTIWYMPSWVAVE